MSKLRKPKKIILIVIDSLRADHLGCYGYKRNTSPNLDRFAEDSVLFRYAFSPAPHTIPVHGSIFTSKYASNHSIGFNQTIQVETGALDTDEDITLAEILSSQGYKTAAFVSGIVLRRGTNLNAGFRLYDDNIGSDHHGRREGLRTNQSVFCWLEDQVQHDFFLFIHYFDVHGPYIPPHPYCTLFPKEEYGQRLDLNADSDNNPTLGKIPLYQILNPTRDEKGNLISFETDARYYFSQYDASVRYCDDIINGLLNRLKDVGIYDDSLIMVTADHGEAMGENNVFFYHGLTVTPDQISVPFIIKPHKGWDVRPRTLTIPINTLDIAPTILSLCNYDYSDLSFQGHSLKTAIEGKDDKILSNRTIISENERQIASISPDLILEVRKKEPPTSKYYPFIPALSDSLDGVKFRCDTGYEYELTLPFDQYQRYRVVTDIVNKYRKHGNRFKIIEVGASLEENLKKFLPNDEVYFMDKDYPEEYKQRDHYIVGDITKTDLEEEYDIVISVDCYEHIPPMLREIYMRKLVGLSRVATIIAAPFEGTGVRESEIIANELYKQIHGKNHRWLQEHIQNGLPSLSKTIRLIDGRGMKHAIIPNGYLPRWFDMISAYFITEGKPEFRKFMREMTHFYNENIYRYDNMNPAYRQVIVINKALEMPDFQDIPSNAKASEKDFAIKSSLLRSYFERFRDLSNTNLAGTELLKEAIRDKDTHISNLQEVVREKESEAEGLKAGLAEKEREIGSLNEIINQRDFEISELTGVLSEKDINIANLEGVIGEKDQNISHLEGAVREKEAEAERLKTGLAEKERKIGSLRETINQKATQISHLEDTVSEKDGEIGSLRETINQKSIQISHLESVNWEREAMLNHIYNSHGWKALLIYYRLRNKILPVNTRRSLFAKILFKLITNPKGLFKNFSKKNIEKFAHYFGTAEPATIEQKIENKISGLSVARENNAPSEPPAIKIEFQTNIGEEGIQDLDFPHYEQPLVSIIIPVWNKWQYTFNCLNSILKNTNDVFFEVIVIDNGSSDETPLMLRKAKHLKVINKSTNIGFVDACNIGANVSNGKYILFLNNDTQVTEGWLKSMVELAEKDDSIGAVGAKLIYSDGKLQEAGGIVWNDRVNLAWNYGRYDNPTKWEYNYVKEVDYCSAACLLVRRDLFERIGLFDERFAPAYCEDTDLAFSIRRLGYKVMYQPKAEVIHFEGTTAGVDTSCGFKSYQIANQEKFYGKWMDVLEQEHFKNGENVFLARDKSHKKEVILFVDHYVPSWDKDAGSLTTWMYLKLFLELGLKIVFVPDNYFKLEPYTTELQQLGIEVVYGSAKFDEWIRQNGKYIHYVWLSRPHISVKYVDMVRTFTKARIMYYMHDFHYLREIRRYEVEKKPETLVEAETQKEMEFYMFKHVDIILTPSEKEVEAVRNCFPNKNVLRIPGYFYEDVPVRGSDCVSFGGRNDLMFLGGFAHLPNVDAVEFFLKEIFPVVKGKLPQIRFYIVGSNLPESIKKYESKDVLPIGYVNTLGQYFNSIRVLVAPLRFGAGVNGKIVTSMTYGVPVVTTSVGNEGLNLVDGYHCMIADTPGEFAAKIVRLYEDKELWKNLSRNSIEFIKDNFSKNRAKEYILRALGQELE
jgi:GT2 family glycosyltransferase/arylsulfatase A-like enzyme/glycosyltransferase involved in cell wall biosynthesis